MALAVERSAFCGSAVARGLPTLAPAKPARSTLLIKAKGGKKINTKTPLGPSGDLNFRNGVDASGRKFKGKGVYQFTGKYGANVDGYSPIYTPEQWAPSGDVYTGGQTGLLLWAVTLGGVLLAGVFLVYSTSALAQ